jgi:hypothetical protein
MEDYAVLFTLDQMHAISMQISKLKIAIYMDKTAFYLF